MYSFGDSAADIKTESLRQTLLNEIYAGAFAGGMSAMLVEEDAIQRVDSEELRNIAQRYGLL